MLKRLLILNSEIYAKADIELENTDSIQIVGPNNIGKSTLIYALNFLYIIDGKQMTFSGGRTGDKKTIQHYFPSINSSYLIFEIFKQRYYCILVKRNADGNLEYYKLDTDYQEDLFFEILEKGKQLRDFRKLLTYLLSKGIEHQKFSTRRDLFSFVYQKGKRSNGVVWIKSSVSQDAGGMSNNFSKIYRYLINSKLINNQTLKDALIIADNRENEKVEFSKKNQTDIQKLLRLNEGIKVIENIQTSYQKFKELVNQYHGKNQMLAELVFSFDKKYATTFSEIGIQIIQLKDKKNEYQQTLNQKLKLELNQFNQKIGGLELQISQSERRIPQVQNSIKEIQALPDESFLNQSFHNLDRDRKTIESQITLIENQNLNSKEISDNIREAKHKMEKLQLQIENYSNQLIHQIAASQKDKELINQILSSEISSLSKENILQPIQQVHDLLTFFDGKIQLPKSLSGKPIASIKDLQQKVEQLRKEKLTQENLLPIAKDLEKHRKNLLDINSKIKDIQEKKSKLESLPGLKKSLEKLMHELEKWKKEKDECEKNITIAETKIEEISQAIAKLTEQIRTTENEKNEIQKWKLEIEAANINPTENQHDQSLDVLYSNFKRNFSERENIKSSKNKLFENLKLQTNSTLASENDFIKYVDAELATLQNKRGSIEVLLKNISTQFATPCKTILARYQDFRTFIVNDFNSKLRKIKISDIDALKIEIVESEKLMKDLEEIMKIRDLTAQLFDDQSQNLETLNKYLDSQRTIAFHDLFDINLHLEKKGIRKVVNLKHQIESDGTDKMIRLVIIMSIINRLVVNSDENKIVLFVDEIGTIDEANRIEILNFCKANHFIPISAAPLHPYDGFDKYYLVRRSKGKIVVSEKNGNVIIRKTK